MTRVIADISMSLDGYVTAPGADAEHGLGVDGEAVHAWVLQEPRSPVDEDILARSFEQSGAVVMGRRLFDIVDAPGGWSEEMGYGHDQDQSGRPPFFVVTHEPPREVRLEGWFEFVTGGVTEAVERARVAAGGKDVVVMGGAMVVDECLAAGLVDELRIHLTDRLRRRHAALRADGSNPAAAAGGRRVAARDAPDVRGAQRLSSPTLSRWAGASGDEAAATFDAEADHGLMDPPGPTSWSASCAMTCASCPWAIPPTGAARSPTSATWP
jgi:dihydrofolate reductase